MQSPSILKGVEFSYASTAFHRGQPWIDAKENARASPQVTYKLTVDNSSDSRSMHLCPGWYNEDTMRGEDAQIIRLSDRLSSSAADFIAYRR